MSTTVGKPERYEVKVFIKQKLLRKTAWYVFSRKHKKMKPVTTLYTKNANDVFVESGFLTVAIEGGGLIFWDASEIIHVQVLPVAE